MAEMLSPGVFVTEIDASTIVPTVSNSIGVFCGDFTQGPADTYTLITSVADLISYYGKPTNDNYNDWYQAYNFLQYGNKLLVARAIDSGSKNGQFEAQDDTVLSNNYTAAGPTVAIAATAGATTVYVTAVTGLAAGDEISFGQSTPHYTIASVDGTANTITLTSGLTAAVGAGAVIYDVTITSSVAADIQLTVPVTILNADDFANSTIAFEGSQSKLKLIARNPGTWSDNIEIAIATPSAFGTTTPSYAFDGIALDDLFEYVPTNTEVGVIVKLGEDIVETWTVDFDENAKDYNNKSTFIETVINNNSNYIFAAVNGANTDAVKDYCFSVNGNTGSTITLQLSADGTVGADDLLTAYELFANKEELDIDIVIGNETDGGLSAKNLVDTRKDCIAFIGANAGDTVGKKSATAVGNLIAWRKTGAANYNNMFVVAAANYKYQYDRYNDKYRWINIAGDIAGLRAQTSMNRASWWASAGLERGQIKNVTKLAFNPTQGQRDLLYKNGLNPICTFPGQGTVMWGQKTLLDKPSSFDRVNVRGLFNTMERALAKMAKYQIMEFNDNFTRNRIVSMIKPYLGSVQAGRGIQDFLVICDESNNTADVISRNQLVVDIYIKPTYVAEFIQLRFTNAGTNSFAEVIGG